MKWWLSVALLVVFAHPVSAQQVTAPPDNLYRAGLVAGIAAGGMDLSITSWCLGKGTCREANPLMRPFASGPLAFGAVRMGVEAFAFWGVTRLHEQGHPTLARVLVWTTAGVYAGIAYRNMRLVTRQP